MFERVSKAVEVIYCISSLLFILEASVYNLWSDHYVMIGFGLVTCSAQFWNTGFPVASTNSGQIGRAHV